MATNKRDNEPRTLKDELKLSGWDAVRLCDYDKMQAELKRLRDLEIKVREFCKSLEEPK